MKIVKSADENMTLNMDGYLLTHTFPFVGFSRESVARMIRKYRYNCKVAGIKPKKLVVRQA